MPDPRAQLATALGGRYEIRREIGVGGSAWVYLARDLRHERDVAIKLLRPALAEALGTQRFLNEIRITARLDHPRVVTLIDSGEAAGLPFYVLPYVRGGSLRTRLEQEGRLEVAEALRITRQVAEALAAAHRQGILHRDIKPENILFQDGEALLTDFGIALATGELTDRITEQGAWLGTPEYMSLEQATGERQLDARSDIYSLAVVLFEMLAGEPPYLARSSQALIAKRLTDPVPSVRRLRATIPAAVDRAITRALAVDPADRFASVAAFIGALEAEVSPAQAGAVAVLPFVATGGDPDNQAFADGITEDVIAHLAKMQALSVISRASVMAFRDRSEGLASIAAKLQAGTILDGSVRRIGERVRIVVQLVDPATGRGLWSESYDRELTDIFAIQTDVALSIARTLEATLSPDEHARVSREPTRNLEAYRLYLQARHIFLRFSDTGMRHSIDFFERAIAVDPAYALAHAGLALAWLELGEIGSEEPSVAYPKALASVNRALELDPQLGEAHSVRGYLRMLTDFDWAGAEEGLRRSLELSPGSADTYDLYGRMCGAMRRFDEAISYSRKSQELDPLAHRIDLATQYLRADRNAEALEVARHSVAFDPSYARAHATLGWALLRTGHTPEGFAALEQAVLLTERHSQWIGQLGLAHAVHGDRAVAEELLGELEGRAARGYVPSYHLAYLYTGLGQHDRAIDIIERSIEQRAAAAYGINGSFLFAPLRGHPRWAGLMRMLKLA